MDTKAAGKAGGRERERGVRHPAAAPPQKHLSIPLLRGSEGGRKGTKGVLRMGNFNQATAVAAQWSGVARRGRACVRESGRIELREKEGWMDGWMVGEESGLLG